MIDLDKEFRTLKLLAQAMIIIGFGLTVGGFGVAFFVSDAAKAKKPAPVVVESAEETPPADPDQPAPPPPKPSKDYSATFSSYTRQISIPSGALGLLFLVFGLILRWIIRYNIDDKDETEPCSELYKAYAEQLVVAERQKEKDRKRLK